MLLFDLVHVFLMRSHEFLTRSVRSFSFLSSSPFFLLLRFRQFLFILTLEILLHALQLLERQGHKIVVETGLTYMFTSKTRWRNQGRKGERKEGREDTDFLELILNQIEFPI